MTVVLGLRHEGGVVLGADTTGFGGWDAIPRLDGKAFKLRPDFAFGFTTSYRFGQIVRFHVGAPAKGTKDKYDLLASKWIPTLRAALKEHGYTKVDNNREEAGTMLVGSPFTILETKA